MLQEAIRCPTNLSNISQILQGKDKSPRHVLKRPMEAYSTYIPFDSEARENQSAINMAVINQRAPDIHWKFQCLHSYACKQLIKLVGIAKDVFNNRETPRINRLEDW